MKTATIRKVLEKKLNGWLSTITDEQLAKDLRGGLLVSGGSIASMLLGESVNDYDVYLNSKELVKRTAAYYTKGFEGIKVLDGALKRLYLEDISHGGGSEVSIRTLKEDQIKIFVEGGGGYTVTNEYPEGSKYNPAYFSPNAISLTDDIQIVLRFYGDPTEVHKTFDFVHATNYFTFNDGVVTNVKALESLLAKTLTYQGSMYPLTSVIRAKKFLKRGFRISAGEYLKMMFQISLLDLTDFDTLEEQLIGVDVAYFALLIKILRKRFEDGSKKLTPEYLNELIDRVFNGMYDDDRA